MADTNQTQKFDYAEEADMATLKTSVQALLDAITALGSGNYGDVTVNVIYDGTNYVATLSYFSYVAS